jgi:hypothetical protein
VDVERVVHRMVAGHLVQQPDLHLVPDPELPVDRGVLGTRLAVDDLPAHVRRSRHPVDRDHVVFPLDPTGRRVVVPHGAVLVLVTSALLLAVVVGFVIVRAGLGDHARVSSFR